jgi:hypothetical protein
MLKLAVIGSRSFGDYALVEKTLDSLQNPLPIGEIVSGGASGADALAARYADKNCIPLTVFMPNYKLYKQGAPLRRNLEIIESCDTVVAFWDGKSKGTKNALEHARRLKKPVVLISIAA